MKEIADAIKNKCCVVFAGAGLSKNAGLPDWLELSKQLFERLNNKGKIPSAYQPSISALLSNRNNIPEVIDLLLLGTRRSDVAKELREILQPRRESFVHQALKKLKLCGYVTTNYDRLIDEILTGNAYHLHNSLDSLKLVQTAVNSSNQFLIKLHGDLDHELPPDDMNVAKGAPFMVLSKTDYTVLLQRERGDALRLALHAVLQKSSVLFIGYRFADPDIRLILDFLSKYCMFSHQSWFIGLKGEEMPQLPSNVKPLQILNDWNELPTWLTNLQDEVSHALITVQEVQQYKISEEDRLALKAVSEYIYGLETDSLSEKILASVLINQLLDKDETTFEKISDYVGHFLDVGPVWAEAFAAVVINHLKKLGILRDSNIDRKYLISKSLLNSLNKKSLASFNEERQGFYASIRKRIVHVGLDLNQELLDRIDVLLQNLCLNYGHQMAEWFQRGIGKEIGQKHVHELVPNYFDNPHDGRKVEELVKLVIENPFTEEVDYIYRLLSAAFLLSSIKLDPSASKYLVNYISEYELYLDSNILLPLLIKEHSNHRWVARNLSMTLRHLASEFSVEPAHSRALASVC